MTKKSPTVLDDDLTTKGGSFKLLSNKLSIMPWWFVAIILIILYVAYLVISSYFSIERMLIHAIEREEITKIEVFSDNPELLLGTEADSTSFRTAIKFLSNDEIITFDSYGDAVRALERGEIDAVLLKEAGSADYIQNSSSELILRGRSLSENDTENYWEALEFIYVGLFITIRVSIVSYLIAIVFGLIAGLGRIANNKFLNNLSTLYVELVRGIPIIVLIFYIALVGVPSVIAQINEFGEWLIAKGLNSIGTVLSNASIRKVPNEGRAIFALSVAYGAFLAEIFRAGIQSVARGQTEAARSLGMSRGEAMRYVILPQAIRNVLPALANDFVAMVKDSSLVSVLAVEDITQRSRKYTGTSFAFREAFNILTILYLTMTVTLSVIVRKFERSLQNNDR